MKKGTIIALIVAVILIIAGGILLMLSLSYAGTAPTAKPTEKTYVVDEAFHSIEIETGECSVTLVKTDGDFRAVCPDTEKQNYIVLVEDGVLKIEVMDMRRWQDFIGFHFAEPEMTVYLPQEQYESLSIISDTGDVDVPQDFSFGTAALRTDTGDITFAATVTGQQTGCLTTEDASADRASPAPLDIRTDTGDIKLRGSQNGSTIHLHTSTGEIAVSEMTCIILTCQSNTGDVKLTSVLADEYLQIFTSTGDVRIQDSDAGSVNIETDTGDVTGSFLSPKYFLIYSDTGDINVPQSRDGGECRIQTNTGDIRFQ